MYYVRKACRDQRFFFFFILVRAEGKAKPAALLVSHLESRTPPSGCSLCSLSRRLPGNRSRTISLRREGTTEAASLRTEGEPGLSDRGSWRCLPGHRTGT